MRPACAGLLKIIKYTRWPAFAWVVLLSVVLSASVRVVEGTGPLSPRERDWLAAHPDITIAPDPDFPPIEFFDEDGAYKGIAADYIALVEKKLGIHFKIVHLHGWGEILEKARRGQVDMFGAATETPQRSEYMRFTSPFVEFPSVIIVRNTVKESLPMKDLSGLKVAIVSGYADHEYVRNHYPQLDLDAVPTVEAGIKKVSFGMVDAFITNLASATYYIEKQGITNLRVAGDTGYVFRLAFAVRRDWPELEAILQKGLDGLSSSERGAVLKKWVHLERQGLLGRKEFWLSVLIGILAACLVMAALVAWNRSLKSVVRQRTEELSNELTERRRAEEALQKAHDELERRVGERTVELTSANDALLAEVTQRKLAEEALQESERRYREVFEHSSDAMFLVDVTPDGCFRFLSYNPAAERVVGISTADAAGKCAEEILPEKVAEAVEANYRECADAGAPISYEETLDFPAGRIDCHVTLIPLKDAAGRVNRIIGIARNITGRKRAEEALKQSEERYRSLFRNNHAPMLLIDPETGAIVDANPAACAYYGYRSEDLLALNIAQINTLTAEEIAVEMRAAQAELRNQFHFRHRLATGQVRYVEVFSGPIRIAGKQLLYSIIHDTTARKLAEEALRDSQQMLQSILDTIPVRVYWKDPDSNFLGCNRSFAADAGLDAPDKILGKSDFDMPWADQAEQLRSDDRQVMGGGRARVCCEEPRTALNGGLIWVRSSKIPLLDGEGRVKGVLGTYEDITEHKRTGEELLRVQKLESIGILAGGIAHDFNNLLGIILGNISVAQMNLNSPGNAAKPLKEAEKAVQRSRELTRQLIIFAKGGPPARRPESITRILEDAVNLGLAGSNVECRFLAARDLRPVNCDSGQIHQALMNLVINAKEAMPEGGILEIQALNVRLTEGEIPLLREDDYIEITVRDHGTGISRENLSKVFDPYFSTKERGAQKGMGLGLTIVYSVILKHGGNITVETEAGAGTTFHLYLPAAGDEMAEAAGHGGTPVADKGRMLFMDDEKMFCAMATQMLTRMGYSVEVARDGAEAIQLFRTAKEHGSGFDVVILDLTVRAGIGGREAIRELLKIDPSIKAVASTGYSEDPVVSRFREYGFSGVLLKPYGVHELRRVLRGLLGEGN